MFMYHVLYTIYKIFYTKYHIFYRPYEDPCVLCGLLGSETVEAEGDGSHLTTLAGL